MLPDKTLIWEGLFVGLLLTTSYEALAQDPGVSSSQALQPYLGKWRPTSFKEEMNNPSLTVSENRLTNEVGGAFVEFRFIGKKAAVVTVGVTKHGPGNNFATVKALHFEIERDSSGRDLLWIHYCGVLKPSPQDCSKNGYVR